jgi:hypothetical protein
MDADNPPEIEGGPEWLPVHDPLPEDEPWIVVGGEDDVADPDKDPIEAELEFGERLLDDEDGEFLSSLLTPQRLPPPHDVDEERAEGLVLCLLGDLARWHVAIHICEHMTWREAYAKLLAEVLHKHRVPRKIATTGWTMNYNFGEDCPRCIARIEEAYGNLELRDQDTDDEDDDEQPF